MLSFFIKDDRCVESPTTDNFYNMRDQIHALLERGGFGSRFPMLLKRFEPSEWEVDELELLQRELEEIIEAFKKLPPEPDLASSGMMEEIGSGRSRTLYDVYRDAEGQPILGSLLDLCRRARELGRPIKIE